MKIFEVGFFELKIWWTKKVKEINNIIFRRIGNLISTKISDGLVS